MPVYEHTSGERQHTAPDSLTDIELGLKALDPASGWVRVDPPADPAPVEPAKPPTEEPDQPEPPADEPAEPEADDTPKPAAARRTKTRS